MKTEINQLKKDCDLLHESNKAQIKNLKDRIKRPTFELNVFGVAVERIILNDNDMKK